MHRQSDRFSMRGGAASRGGFRSPGYRSRPSFEQRPLNNGLFNRFGQQESMDRTGNFAEFSDFGDMDGDMYEQPTGLWQPQPDRLNMTQVKQQVNQLSIQLQEQRAWLISHDRSLHELCVAKDRIETGMEENAMKTERNLEELRMRTERKLEELKMRHNNNWEEVKGRVKQVGDIISTNMGDNGVDPSLTFPQLS